MYHICPVHSYLHLRQPKDVSCLRLWGRMQPKHAEAIATAIAICTTAVSEYGESTACSVFIEGSWRRVKC